MQQTRPPPYCTMSASHSQQAPIHSYTATHRNPLHTSRHCKTLPHNITCCHTQEHTETHSHALPRTATHCHALSCTATHCHALPHSAIQCNRHYPMNTSCHTYEGVIAHIQPETRQQKQLQRLRLQRPRLQRPRHHLLRSLPKQAQVVPQRQAHPPSSTQQTSSPTRWYVCGPCYCVCVAMCCNVL